MELMNKVARFDAETDEDRAVVQEALKAVVLMLSPIVPHICHRLWQVLGHQSAPVDEDWPVVDADALQIETSQIIVQVNGKLRARLELPVGASRQAVEDAALTHENVQRFVADKEIRKVIVVPGKLVNVVV
jgi:leucyl-tRNA synthetase